MTRSLKEDRFIQHLKTHVYQPLIKVHQNLSLQIAVQYKNKVYRSKFGPEYKYFDYASLTKPMFTMALVMHLEDKQPGFVNKKVHHILPWFPHKEVQVLDLLSHQSGAPAVYPVYKDLNRSTLDGLSPLNLFLREIAFEQKEPLYSDVGYFVLGAILEASFNLPLVEIFKQAQAQTIDSFLCDWHPDIHFKISKDSKNPKFFQTDHYIEAQRFKSFKNYAPTEDCPLRGKKIQGEVHDESCWKMGGLGPHAGFFGSMESLIDWVQKLNKVFIRGQKYKSTCISKFYKPQKGDWRLGMMLPSQPRSTAGQYFSKSSYGHLGFTGTSFWVDPEKAFSVMILSNRTYPDRKVNSLNQYRPFIHDTLWEFFN